MLYEFLWTIILLTILLFLLFKYLDGNRNYWTKCEIRNLEIDWSTLKKFQNMADLFTKTKAYYSELGQNPYGGMVDFRVPNLLVREPDLLRSILVKDFDHFVDRRAFKSDPTFAKFLTSLSGSEWKSMRSLLSPTFTTGKIRRMYDNIFLKCSDQFNTYIENQLEKSPDRILDMPNSFRKYTLAVISSSAFGIESHAFEENSLVEKMVNELLAVTKMIILKFSIMIAAPKLAEYLKLRTLSGRGFDFFKSILENNIRLRETQGEKREDFLQLMIEARSGVLKGDATEVLSDFEKEAQIKNVPEGDKKNVKLTNEDIVAQSVLFLFAGFESIGSTIGFTFYHLALYQDWQEKIWQEVKSTIKEFDGKLTYEGVNKMELLDRFISETQRLYPANFTTERKCTKDYLIPGTEKSIIKSGTLVTIPIYCLHHDVTFFPNPEKFDPDRFSPENKDKIIPYTFIPFGSGPRNCIGMRFAQTEVKTIVANFLLKFKIEPCHKTEIPIKPQIIATGQLKAEAGLTFKISQRI